jgi:hypothetical protein
MKDLRQAVFCCTAKAVERTCGSDHGSFGDRSAPVMAELQRWLRHRLAAQLEFYVS